MHTLKFYWRVILSGLWAGLCALVGLVLGIPFFRHPNFLSAWVKTVGIGILKIANIKVELIDRHHMILDLPCIYFSNHQSVFDLFAFGSFCAPRTTIIGKQAILWIPFIGQFLYMAGGVFIDRKNPDQSIPALKRLGNHIRKNRIKVALTPEGTRNKHPTKLLPFKKGGFHLAIENQIPIVPMVALPYGEIASSRLKRFGDGTIHIRILAPVETKGLTVNDVDALRDKLYTQMSDALANLIRDKS